MIEGDEKGKIRGKKRDALSPYLSSRRRFQK